MATRRDFLLGAVTGAAGSVAAYTASSLINPSDSFPAPTSTQAASSLPKNSTVPALGVHQSGIEMHVQGFTKLIALNLKPTTTLESMSGFLNLIADDIDRLTQAQPALADPQPEISQRKSNLTIAVGFGVELFEKLGIQDKAPESFKALPSFGVDQLEERYSGGDMVLHLCGDDQLVLEHVTRILVRDSDFFASVKFIQSGFSSIDEDSPLRSQRNLMGQIDGTKNPEFGSENFQETVWADSGPEWYQGGTMMVFRRIRMNLETWDAMDESGKEEVIGRKLSNGAPLGGESETDFVNLDARWPSGLKMIPDSAHIARAASAENGFTIFRRPFNFHNGFDEIGKTDAGLLWFAYAKDAHAQYVPIQTVLDQMDHLNQWTTPVGSGLYIFPKGRNDSTEPIAKGLFA